MSDLTSFLLAGLDKAKDADSGKGSSESGAYVAQRGQPITTLKLSATAEKVLVLAGVTSVEQLSRMSGADLLTLPGMDVATAAEIRRRIQPYREDVKAPRQPAQPPHREHSDRAQPPKSPSTESRPQPTTRQKRPLADLKIPMSYIRALEHHGITTVEDLCLVSKEDLTRKFFLGSAAARAIHNAVVRAGMRMAAAVTTTQHVVRAPVPSSVVPPTKPSLPPRAPLPEGPLKWLELFFASLSRVERTILIARHGLDGKGARSLAVTAIEAGVVTSSRAAKLEATAIARLKHPVVRTRLKALAERYSVVVWAKKRACSVDELAVVVGHPDARDGYDAVAFTRFILPFCSGLYQVQNELWGVEGHLESTNKHLASEVTGQERSPVPAVPPLPPAPEIPAVRLSQVRRVEARVVALVCALAAEARSTVDFRRLKDFADVAGVRLTQMASIDMELGADGIWIRGDRPGELRLCSSLKLLVGQGDLPGKLGDLSFLRGVLPKAGVLKRADSEASFPLIEIAQVSG